MWFKNAQIYRLPPRYALTPAQLEAFLKPHAIVPASSNELLRQGWSAPRPNGGLVHAVNKQMLIRFDTEQKILPARVINQVAKNRAAEMEEAQGFAPGRKAMKDLKERIADELLPRAFSDLKSVYAWLDPVNGWLVVDTPTPSKADDVLKFLLKAVDRFPVESLRVQRSPVGVMTEWLQTDAAPLGFTVDQNTTMRATGESKAQITYKNQTPDVAEMRRHIAAGKQCTRLALTWDSKISFVLTDSLTIKGIKPLDVISEKESSIKNDVERFDGDFMLMTGELAKLIADVTEALGGEANYQSDLVREQAQSE